MPFQGASLGVCASNLGAVVLHLGIWFRNQIALEDIFVASGATESIVCYVRNPHPSATRSFCDDCGITSEEIKTFCFAYHILILSKLITFLDSFHGQSMPRCPP